MVLPLSSLAACGNLSGNNGSASNSTAASGVIKVMTLGNWNQPALGTSDPEYPAGALAAAAAVNASGGIGGRKVQVIVCSDDGDPNVARSCADKAVSDHVMAIVGLQSLFAPNILPTLRKASIPVIGAVAFGTAEVQSPNSFALTGGILAEHAGGIYALKRAGATKIRYVAPAGTNPPALMQVMEAAAKANGLTWADPVFIPQKASDLSAVVAAATSGGVNGIIGFGADEAGFIQAFRTQAPKVRIATTTFNMTKSVITTLGSASNGVLLAPGFIPYDVKTAGSEQYAADMKKYESKYVLSNVGLQEWLAFDAFAKVAGTIPDVSPQSVVTAFSKVKNLKLDGLIPPYSTTTVGGGDYARMFNPTAYLGSLKNGTFRPLAKNQGFTTTVQR